MKTGIGSVWNLAVMWFRRLFKARYTYTYWELHEFESTQKVDLFFSRVHIPLDPSEKVSVEIKRKAAMAEVTIFDAPGMTIATIVHAEMLCDLIRTKFLPNLDPDKITWKILYRNWEKNYDHLMDVKLRFDRKLGYYHRPVFTAVKTPDSISAS